MSERDCDSDEVRGNQGLDYIKLPDDLNFEENASDIDELIKIMENSNIAKTECIDNTIPDSQKDHPLLSREDVIDNMRRLYTDVLKRIQDKLGPMYITSGYRCPVLNEIFPEAVGKSRHLYGLAADFAIDVEGMLPENVCAWVNNESDIVVEELIPNTAKKFVHIALAPKAGSKQPIASEKALTA